MKKIKWLQNGFKFNGKFVKGSMHISTRWDGSKVLAFYASEYGMAVPAELVGYFGVENKTDTMTDYFEHDHFDMAVSHPEFQSALQAYIAKCRNLVKVCKNAYWKTGREAHLAEAQSFVTPVAV